MNDFFIGIIVALIMISIPIILMILIYIFKKNKDHRISGQMTDLEKISFCQVQQLLESMKHDNTNI
jgi:uncharacterized membrane protein affecting hemolysin expression